MAEQIWDRWLVITDLIKVSLQCTILSTVTSEHYKFVIWLDIHNGKGTKLASLIGHCTSLRHRSYQAHPWWIWDCGPITRYSLAISNMLKVVPRSTLSVVHEQLAHPAESVIGPCTQVIITYPFISFFNDCYTANGLILRSLAGTPGVDPQKPDTQRSADK